MSLLDRITPSERAADLLLVVRRIRRHTGLDVVPMLVVEGPNDQSLLANQCGHGPRQVFAAGTRGLVEQMLVYLRANPIEGCECVYLTDCDGYGKAVGLKQEPDLVVTRCCDSEADLVSLGVATRVTSSLVEADAEALVSDAVALGLPLSIVRRRAAAASVSMKRSGRRLRLTDLPTSALAKWAGAPPSIDDVVGEVAGALKWSPDESTAVTSASLQETPTFERFGSGKDTLDALWFLLENRGLKRGITADVLHRMVRHALTAEDIAVWEVGRRILAWQEARGVTLLECG